MAPSRIDPQTFRADLTAQFEALGIEASAANISKAGLDLDSLLDGEGNLDRTKLVTAFRTLTRADRASTPTAVTLMGAMAVGTGKVERRSDVPMTPDERRADLVAGMADYVRNITRDDDPVFITSGLEEICEKATDDNGEISAAKLKGLIEAETLRALNLVEAYINGTRPLPQEVIRGLPAYQANMYLMLHSEAGSAYFRYLAFSHLNGYLPPETTMGVELQALHASFAFLQAAEAGQLPSGRVAPDAKTGAGALFAVVRDNPALKDYVKVTNAEGMVTIKANSHHPERPVETSVAAAARHFNILRRLVSDMVRCLKAGDEAGFDRMLALWGAQCIENLGMKIEIEGLKNLDPDKNYIFAPTHASSFEFPLLCFLLNPWSLGFLAKDAFRKYPLFGTVMSQSDRFFFVNRSNRDQAAKTMYAMAEALSREDYPHSQVVYPEGTRQPGRIGPNGERLDPLLGQLKSGLGYLAMDTVAAGNPVEVVPIVINGLGALWPKGMKAPQVNGAVKISIGKPIDPSQFADDPDAPKKVVAAVDQAFQASYASGVKPRTEKTVLVKVAPRGLKARLSDLADAVLMAAARLPNALLGSHWQKPLIAPHYTEDERLRLGWAHLVPKIQMLWKGLRHADMFLPNVTNPGLRALLKLVSFGSGQGETLKVFGADQMVSPEARINPMNRDEVFAALRALQDKHQLLTLSSVVSARIDESYGFDPELARSFKEYTLEYLQFIMDDTDQLMALMEQDVPVDDTAVTAALKAHTQAAEPATKKYGTYQFALLREFYEAESLKTPPAQNISTLSGGSDKAQAAFAELENAEGQLGALVTAGADERALAMARREVAQKFSDYSAAAGLAAGPETFLYLSDPANGLFMSHAMLKRALNVNSSGNEKNYALTTSVLRAHEMLEQKRAELDQANESQKIKIKTFAEEQRKNLPRGLSKKQAHQIVAEKLTAFKQEQKVLIRPLIDVFEVSQADYQSAMRTLLDVPGVARRIQRNLLRFNATFEALVKDPTGLCWTVYSRVFEFESQHARIGDLSYASIMHEFLGLQGLTQRSQAQEKRMAQLIQAASVKAFEMLQSERGALLIRKAASFMGNRLEQALKDENFNHAMETSGTYWQVRRTWAKAEKSRKEDMVEPIARFAFERKETMGHLFLTEVDMTLKAAEAMMAKVRAVSKSIPDRRIEKIYQEALARFYTDARQAAEKSPTEAFKVEWEKQLTHLDILLDAEGREHPAPHDMHRINYNRAVEAASVHAAAAFRMAARLYHKAGLAPRPPRLVGYQTIGVLTKTNPDLSLKGQFKDGKNITRYMSGFIPLLRDVILHLGEGLPTAEVQPAIRRWAKYETFDFHHTEVDDRRPENSLPGAVSFMNGNHTGGWFADYNTTVALGGRGDYTIIGKGDLSLPGVFGAAAGLALRMLPERVSAPEAQAFTMGQLLKGYVATLPAGSLARGGSQPTAVYNTLSMSMMAAPDPNLVDSQSGLLSAQWRTGMELNGMGRDLNVLLGSAAVYGSMAKVPWIDVEGKCGGLEAGSNPKDYVRITPAQLRVTVESFDPLAIPSGEKLDPDGASPSVKVSAHELNTWFQRQAWVLEEGARRLVEKNQGEGGNGSRKPKPAPVKPVVPITIGADSGWIMPASPVVAAPVCPVSQAAAPRLPSELAALKARRQPGIGILSPNALARQSLSRFVMGSPLTRR